MMNSFLFFILILAGIGLNYLNTFGIFDVDKTGVFWVVMRISMAITITAIAIISMERFFEEALPKRDLMENESTKPRNVIAITFWTIFLVISEAVIYLFASSNMGAAERIGIGKGTAIGMMILSMVIPIVAGTLGWLRTSRSS